MADIDLSRLNVDQLTELVGKAQTEVASREKRRRKDLRSELERRIAADGYKLGDIFRNSQVAPRTSPSVRRGLRSTGIRRTPNRHGQASGGRRNGCRRYWANGESTSRRSSKFRCTRFTRRAGSWLRWEMLRGVVSVGMLAIATVGFAHRFGLRRHGSRPPARPPAAVCGTPVSACAPRIARGGGGLLRAATPRRTPVTPPRGSPHLPSLLGTDPRAL